MKRGYTNLTVMGFVITGLLAFVVGFTYNVMVSADPSSMPLRIGQAASADTAAADTGAAEPKPLEMFWETYTLIRQHYRLAEGPNWKDEDLLDAGLDGLLRSLGDPYTRFLPAKAYAEMMETNRGQFQGIGAYLKEAGDGKHVLLAPISGGPAAQAGLKPGDILLKIDNTDAIGIKIDRAKDLIRGPAGTTVKLTVGRLADPRKPKGADNPQKTYVLTVKRDIIKPEEIKFQAGPPSGHEKDKEIGYVMLQQFSEDTENQLDHALAALNEKKVKGLVLDLRGNPGGLLDAAIGVASRFVDGGPVVWIQEAGGMRHAHNADRRRYLRPAKPLVILVNRGSASASEIVSGALHDRGVAKLIGETTFGKGLVQTIIPLDSEGAIGALKITTARYFTPNGTDINHKGIKPDEIVVGNASADNPFEPPEANAKDPQLDRAVEVLKQEIAQGDTKVATKPR